MLAHDAFSLDWNEFDALYLYNPFELPLFTDAAGVPDHRIQVARVEARLAALPVGTRVVTLNGFGGVMPGTFELLYHERAVIGVDLVCWIQRSGSRRRVAAS